MAARVFEYPLGGGVDESVDRVFLPDDKLSRAENVRLDRAGRLEVRPANSPLATTTYSASAMTAYDLANFNGRLVALGDQCGLSRPTDLFEFVDASPAKWRATAAVDDGFSSGPRLPRATNAREVGRLADQSNGVDNVHVAAGAGFVCAVANMTNSRCVIHIFNPATDQTIIAVTRNINTARVTFAGSDFWIVGQSNINDDIEAHNFDPLTDETLQGPTTISTAPAGTVTDIAVAQTGASDFSVIWAQSTTTTAHRVNSAGSVQATWSVTGGDFRALGICGNTAGTLISILAQRGADGTYRLNTYNAAGVLQAGPTTTFGGAAGTVFARAGLAQSGTQVMLIGFEDDSPTQNIVTQLMTSQAAHSLGSVIRYADALPTANSVPIVSGGQTNFYYGATNSLAGQSALDVGGAGTNMLVEAAQRLPQCYKDGTLAGRLHFRNDICSSALIGTKIYWGNTVRGVTGGDSFQVTELDMNDTGRRQMTQLANQLHIAGAMPMVYDGRLLVEQGFAELPVCQLSQGTVGGLTLLGRYFVVVVWELVDANGNIVRSQSSLPAEITLTGANDSITVVATTPHSLRVHPLLQASSGISVRVGFYRTQANDSVFILDSFSGVAVAEFGEPITATLAKSDDTLIANGAVLYEQSQTPIPHVSPPPYRYTWPARERQFIGGLPDASQWAFSKLMFPSEPMAFAPSGELGFFGRARQAITAVAAFETAAITFTQSDIAQIAGRGPERNGTGDFDAAMRIPSPGGCIDWRSLVDTTTGLFFQMSSDKLMLLSRDGGVSWLGAPVRDTLAAFPTVVGAVHVRSENLVAFACNDLAGTDARILLFDEANGQWSVDTVGAPVSAITELNGRIAFISAGIVYLQDAAIGSGVGALPTMRIERHFRLFTAMGYGTVTKIGLLGTYLGDCTVTGFISYDDGKTWSPMGGQTVDVATFTNALTGAPIASGDPITLIFTPNRREVDRFAVRFDVTNAANTGAVRLHAISIEAEAQEFTTRRPARDQR